MRKHIPLRFQNPDVKRGRPAGSGPVQNYMKRLAKHPNRWALFSNSYKSPNGLLRFRKEYPGLEIVSRKNPNGTYKVWVRINSVSQTVHPQEADFVKYLTETGGA